MKIVVLSDSHNDYSSIKLLNNHIKDADFILHCGDGSEDLEALGDDVLSKVYAVRGNCDISRKYPSEQVIDICGVKIFITHGHMYNVKNEYNTIFYKAKELGVDIALFGHSHKAMISKHSDVIIMNPGSISLPYMGFKKSIGIIEIFDNKEVDCYLVEV